jgi:hypothetical protein
MRPYSELLDTFLRLEDEEGFFERTLAGVPFWDLIRPLVMDALVRATSGVGRGELPPLRVRAQNWFGWMPPRRNPWLMPKRDVLFWGHSRRQRLDDGLHWDIYVDPLLEQARAKVNYVEEPFRLAHLTPAKTAQVRYGEGIVMVSELARRLLRRRPLEDSARAVEQRVNEVFGSRLEIAAMAAEAVAVFEAYRSTFRNLLRYSRPRVVVTVTAYVYKWLVAGAQDLGIPVVELQHGYAGRLHIGYAYRQYSTRNRILPDHFFSWGSFWNPGMSAYVPIERTHAVGFAHFHNCRRRYPARVGRSGPRRLLFISQGRESSFELSRVAAELARGQEFQVIYRLHPGVDHDWRTQYPHLDGAGVEIQDGRSSTVYDALAQADAVAGVSSTSLFESVGWGLPTFVHRVPLHEYLQPMLEQKLALAFDGAEELRRLVRETPTPAAHATEELFGDDPARRFWEELSRL